MTAKLNPVLMTALVIAFAALARGQTLEVLHSFQGRDGASPKGSLVEGSDGCFYGTTDGGGTNVGSSGYSGYGTVFKLSTDGMLTTLVRFNGPNGEQ